MKKRILIIILILLILSTIFITYLKITSNKKTINKTTTINDITYETIQQIEICKEQQNCPILSETRYEKLIFDFNNEEVQEWINKINQEIETNYQNDINYNCPTNQDKYNYTKVTKAYNINYINDTYISLSIKRMKYDFCTNNNEELPTETLLFNQKKNKVITQDELKTELNLTHEKVKESIIKNIDDLNQKVPEDFDYTNYHLYYDVTGCLLAEYQLPNKEYYSAIVIHS